MVQKRLYRSETDRMLSGVCGGLGEYFGVDSSIIRILFVLAVVWMGSGLLIYIILALIIPSKSSAGVLTEETINENAKDMENVAKKVAKTVEEKVSNVTSKQQAAKPVRKARPAAKKKTVTKKKASK